MLEVPFCGMLAPLAEEYRDMWCRRGTEDPIAKAMFDEEGLIILRNGRSMDEVEPGRIIRIAQRRDAVYDTGAALFFPFNAGTVLEKPFARLGRSVKSTYSAEAAAHVSQTIAPAPIGTVGVKAALDHLQIGSMTVNLSGASRRFIDVNAIEKRLLAAEATPLQTRYREEGQALYLVTETLVVATLVISLDQTDNGKVDAFLDADVIAALKMSGKRNSKTEAVIELTPDVGDVVVGVKAIEILPSDVGGFMLKGLHKTLSQIRDISRKSAMDVKRVPEYMVPEDFSDSEELSLSIEL